MLMVEITTKDAKNEVLEKEASYKTKIECYIRSESVGIKEKDG